MTLNEPEKQQELTKQISSLPRDDSIAQTAATVGKKAANSVNVVNQFETAFEAVASEDKKKSISKIVDANHEEADKFENVRTNPLSEAMQLSKVGDQSEPTDPGAQDPTQPAQDQTQTAAGEDGGASAIQGMSPDASCPAIEENLETQCGKKNTEKAQDGGDLPTQMASGKVKAWKTLCEKFAKAADDTKKQLKGGCPVEDCQPHCQTTWKKVEKYMDMYVYANHGDALLKTRDNQAKCSDVIQELFKKGCTEECQALGQPQAECEGVCNNKQCKLKDVEQFQKWSEKALDKAKAGPLLGGEPGSHSLLEAHDSGNRTTFLTPRI